MNHAQSRAVGRALSAPNVRVDVQTVIDCGDDRVVVPTDDGHWRLTRIILTTFGATFYGYRQTSQGRDAHPSGPRPFTPTSNGDPGDLRARVSTAIGIHRGVIPGDIIDLLTDLRTELT